MAQGRFHHIARPVQIVADDLGGIQGPEAVVGRHMEQQFRSGHGAIDGRRIAQVALAQLDLEAGEVLARAAGADQRANSPTGSDKSADHGRAHETGGARHQDAFGRAHPIFVPGFAVEISLIMPQEVPVYRGPRI